MNENENTNSLPLNSDENPSQNSSGRMLREIFDWLETFAFAFAFVLIVFTFIFRVVTVDGKSMHYTLDNGDKLIISDVLYTPSFGDIIVVSNNATGNRPIIKRVIATEGQVVDINFDTWEITVDGQVLSENYINDEEKEFGIPLTPSHYQFPLTVSENCVFVLGDNRNHSSDSRYYGQFSRNEIMGRVLFRIFPFSDIGTVKPAQDERIARIKEKYNTFS